MIIYIALTAVVALVGAIAYATHQPHQPVTTSTACNTETDDNIAHYTKLCDHCKNQVEILKECISLLKESVGHTSNIRKSRIEKNLETVDQDTILREGEDKILHHAAQLADAEKQLLEYTRLIAEWKNKA